MFRCIHAYICEMNFNIIAFLVILLGVVVHNGDSLQRRCIRCRSRGELGSCGDPFSFNITEPEAEIGIHVVACPSGWCGKILEGVSGAYRTEEYGAATQRMCLSHPPSDYEERCAYTMWNHRKVYMCFCTGDLCNATSRPLVTPLLLFSLAFCCLWYH